ncbi:hypothetical protein BCR33DRAFT_569714 [Rhizoclosmatium globosum]|uniref:Uncharacterized protein n=1 Tax=Rhizoclosmatium globosum TaxID=329046 RepID=A0A1Y2B609_9FUNG|nr:hypothetical protein BCR33DRAFT_569714 [Rhizoclosmatium globosum]|eukprot:ORY30126.1 hypothetical protein BCR33DRAFT_569714 [Rhizoclosmatium globosum]
MQIDKDLRRSRVLNTLQHVAYTHNYPHIHRPCVTQPLRPSSLFPSTSSLTHYPFPVSLQDPCHALTLPTHTHTTLQIFSVPATLACFTSFPITHDPQIPHRSRETIRKLPSIPGPPQRLATPVLPLARRPPSRA